MFCKHLVICSLGNILATHTIKPFENDVNLTALPATVFEGLTKHLNINCTFLDLTHNDFTTVMSIILSKSTSDTDPAIFNEIATLTSVAPYTVEVKRSLGAEVKGQMLVDSISFLSFDWVYPTTEVVGTYRCEAYGMDKTGHPVESTADVQVSQVDVDLDFILSHVRELAITQERLVSQLQNTTSQLSTSQVKLEHLENKLNVAETALNVSHTKLEDFENRLANFRAGMMESSTVYRNHRYFLSALTAPSPMSANTLCPLYNGYLAEINDQNEFAFINNYLKTQIMAVNYECVIVGSTDAGHEGQWSFMNSRKQMTYFNWRPSNPNNISSHDCMWLCPVSGNFQMDDYPCDTHAYYYRFLCEIP